MLPIKGSTVFGSQMVAGKVKPPVEKTDEPKLYTTDGKEVPIERIKAMQQYAAKLRKKFPHMSPGRIERKTAEYFKVKLK